MSGAVISDDHGDESLNVEHMARASPTHPDGGGRPRAAPGPRPISAEEVQRHNGRDGGSESFWAVIDGFVVDASAFVDAHPGGLRKLLSTDSPAAGASGKPFGFSFSRGRNAHFPGTGKRFRDGVERYLRGDGVVGGGGRDDEPHDEPFLPPAEVAFPPYGQVLVLGRLES